MMKIVGGQRGTVYWSPSLDEGGLHCTQSIFHNFLFYFLGVWVVEVRVHVRSFIASSKKTGSCSVAHHSLEHSPTHICNLPFALCPFALSIFSIHSSIANLFIFLISCIHILLMLAKFDIIPPHDSESN